MLLTGFLLAKSTWNVWWRWNVRLIITLVSCLMYLACLMFRRSVKEGRGTKFLAVFGIIAFFTIPFVLFAIRQWGTQYVEPLTMGLDIFEWEFEMLVTLLASVIMFMLLFFYLLQHRVTIEHMEDELERIRQTVAENERNRCDILVENQNFIIEDYVFKEYKKKDE